MVGEAQNRPFQFSFNSSLKVDCKREVNAAPRSHIFSEPINRKAGS